MPRAPARIPDAWPRLMPGPVAAVYCGESSVDTFRRRVGTLWPKPRVISGLGERWLREDLDAAIETATGVKERAGDRLADVL